MGLRKFFKKKGELRVYGYDNFHGDKGVIIANSYDDAVRIYRESYERKIANNHNEYVNDGCYLSDLGCVGKDQMYVNTEW